MGTDWTKAPKNVLQCLVNTLQNFTWLQTRNKNLT